MMMEFAFQDTKSLHKIKVFGIGGGGNNAINNMILAGVEGPLFVAANSDLQDLERNLAPHKVQVGSQLTKGLGCGGKAEIGKAAAQEDLDRIKDMLADSDMVFITAGMGGGTGSGGAPVVAEALTKLSNPPLVVAVVTKPFEFEGPRRMTQAVGAIDELSRNCDCIIVVPNEKLMATMPKGCTLQEAFHEADTVLLKAVQGITDLITGKGLVNVDFQDLKTVMTKRGPTIMGVGQASGEDRALKAAQQAVSSPLLDDLSIDGAQGILINITGPSDLGLEEVSTVCSLVTREAHPDAEIFHGVTFDESLAENGLIKVTVIATGLGGAPIEKRENVNNHANVRASQETSKAEAVSQPQNVFNAAKQIQDKYETSPAPAHPVQAKSVVMAPAAAQNNPIEALPIQEEAPVIPTAELLDDEELPAAEILNYSNESLAKQEDDQVQRTAARVTARQSRENAKFPEREAAAMKPRSSSSGTARRNRLARRYESIHLDGDNFDVPTYLRHSAD